MKPRPFALLFIPLILLASCNSLQPDFGLATDYFPSAKYLREGIVNKYYQHSTDKDGDVRTFIQYRQYQLTKENEFTESFFDPAMELVSVSRFQFAENKLKLKERVEYYQGDTITTVITNEDFVDWQGQDAGYSFQKKYESGVEVFYSQSQTAAEDSIVENRPAKVFAKRATQERKYQGESTTTDFNFLTTYMKGIGLYGYELTYEGGNSRLELVEQIPLKTFQEMANHGVKRIGYIDPRRVLDQDSNFKLCGRHDDVADYYNGQDKIAQYKGGKRAIWELVNKHLDKSKLFEESGYLTLRFIVNCEGEAGWFTMEEADLDFQPKHFPSETIQHFFEILYQHPDWKPCIIREEARDAYTYTTFKLSQGEIIEILP
jgi:hypothetical protein